MATVDFSKNELKNELKELLEGTEIRLRGILREEMDERSYGSANIREIWYTK